VPYTDTQELLIFAGIPLAVIGLIFALVYLSGARSAKRYRPGRAYAYAPVWFLARPETDGPAATHAASHAASHSAEIGGAVPRAEITAADGSTHPGVTGGASDRW
jgi:hypothetical protein